MYLKVNCTLEFPQLGRLLSPDAATESFEHDFENVYEWMSVKIPSLPFLLNISRAHGWADIDDDLVDVNSAIAAETLKSLVQPGPVYIFGWSRSEDFYVDSLPDWLPQYVADLLLEPVAVYDGRVNVDQPDSKLRAIVRPQREARY